MVQGHGIPSELVRDVRRVVEGYFSRSAEEKMLDCISPDNYTGYIPLGFFSPNTGGNTPDRYEGYKLHHETSLKQPIREQCDLYGPNKWPAEPEGMSEVITKFWQACDVAGRHLLKLISQIMGVDKTAFLSFFDDPLTNMTLLHYPSQPADRPKVGIHPHKDTDALTCAPSHVLASRYLGLDSWSFASAVSRKWSKMACRSSNRSSCRI